MMTTAMSIKETFSVNTIPTFCLVLCFFDVLLFRVISNCVRRICKSASRSVSETQSAPAGFSRSLLEKGQDFELSKPRPACSSEEVEDGNYVRREDVETVMTSLGIFCHPAEGEKLQERLGFDDISKMFEEKEPSLEEVKGAFDVFDENGDGLIVAGELQRVLCNLGFREGLEMENCRRMIDAFDENGDGRIDFDEFVKFMEKTSC